MIGITWERTNDEQGHKSLFEIKCKYCNIDLMFRGSLIMKPKSKEQIIGMNKVGFKCKRCGFYRPFYVEDTKEYLGKILKIRNDVSLFTPNWETWSEDDEKRRQLEALGYIGGR